VIASDELVAELIEQAQKHLASRIDLMAVVAGQSSSGPVRHVREGGTLFPVT
jgi:hypothetical protein